MENHFFDSNEQQLCSLHSWCSNPVKLSNGKSTICTVFRASPIEEGDFVTATGNISLKNVNGEYDHYIYCDIGRFNNGKIAELKAFVIEKKS